VCKRFALASSQVYRPEVQITTVEDLINPMSLTADGRSLRDHVGQIDEDALHGALSLGNTAAYDVTRSVLYGIAARRRRRTMGSIPSKSRCAGSSEARMY